MAKLDTPDQTEIEDTPGNRPSAAKFGIEQIKQAEDESIGKLESPNQTSTAKGKVSYNTGGEGTKNSASDSSTSTAAGKVDYNTSDDVPPAEQSFYKSSATKPGKVFIEMILGTRRRKAAFGSGIIGTIVGAIAFFTISSGPFQFIHIAQLLTQFHFSTQQDQSDDRFTKIARYIRYNSQGKVENTRIGILQRKYLKPIDLALSSTGLESAYSPVFGFKDGYIVDPDKLSGSSIEELQGKNTEQIKAYFEENFPKATVEIVDGKVSVGVRGLSVSENRSLNRTMLKAAGLSKITSTVGARVMGQRDGVTWHPIKNLDRKILRSAEDRYTKWKSNQVEVIDKGAGSTLATEDDAAGNKDASDDSKNNAASTKKAADGTLSDGQTAGGELAAGDTEAVSRYSAKLKAGLTGTAALGILCTARGLAQNADNVKQQQVVLPLIRQAMQVIALGNQIESGQGLDTEQLGFFNRLLSGVDSQGNKTTAVDAESIQAELGHPNTGVPPSKTLQTIDKGTPFDFLLPDGILGSVLNGVCGKVGTAVQFAIGFLGGPVSASLSTAISYALAPTILSPLAHWLAGDAVETFPIGADFGNNVNYGAKLAANGEAISAGGVPLTSQQVTQLDNAEATQAQQDFQSHNIAYKLFNPYDAHSAISKVIDNTSPSVTQNFASLGTSFLNFGHTLANLPSLFGPKVSAATTAPYDYGFPTFGFSQDEMSDPQVENPFANAESVVNTILPAHADYIDRASQCFGVTIDPTSYDITSWQGDEPKYTDISKHTCTDSSESWRQLRFYIFDSQTMESSACYYGDAESCSDMGFDGSTATAPVSNTPTTGTTAPSGNSQQLAQQILANKNIDLTSFSQSVLQDVQAAAAGKDGTAGVPTSSAILQLIETIGEKHKVLVTAIQSSGQGHCNNTPKSGCPKDPHYNGDAVDFGNLDGTSLLGRDPGSMTIIQAAVSVLPTGSGFGQSQCGPAPTLPSGYQTFEDTCNHLHVQVPAGTP